MKFLLVLAFLCVLFSSPVLAAEDISPTKNETSWNFCSWPTHDSISNWKAFPIFVSQTRRFLLLAGIRPHRPELDTSSMTLRFHFLLKPKPFVYSRERLEDCESFQVPKRPRGSQRYQPDFRDRIRLKDKILKDMLD